MRAPPVARQFRRLSRRPRGGTGNSVVTLAVDMAAKYGANLHVLHVVSDMQLPAQMKKAAQMIRFTDERDDILRKIAETILHEAEVCARKKGAQNVRTAISGGDPAGAVIDYARRKKIDLVILGTRGLGKVKGMLLGSVSRKITDLGNMTCLIVR